jgi:hypothetical protein
MDGAPGVVVRGCVVVPTRLVFVALLRAARWMAHGGGDLAVALLFQYARIRGTSVGR